MTAGRIGFGLWGTASTAAISFVLAPLRALQIAPAAAAPLLAVTKPARPGTTKE